MYRLYVVPNATSLSSHAQVYSKKELFWDPYAESDAYAVIDPHLKGEINKASSLEFTILPANVHYDDFEKKRTVVLAYDDDELIFEGYVTSAPSDFYKQKKVTCVSALAYLCDSIQAPFEKIKTTVPTSEKDNSNYSGKTKKSVSGTKATINAYLQMIVNAHNSQVDPFKRIKLGSVISDSEKYTFSSSGYRNSWDAIENDIIQEHGHYITITTGNDQSLYLNYTELSSSDDPPVIEFGNNMLEMNESNDDDDDLFTVLLPVGKDKLTVKNVSGHDSPKDNTNKKDIDPYIKTINGDKHYVVVSNKALNTYGYIVKTQSFSNVSKASELYSRAVEYIENNFDFHKEYEVKGIDLRFIDPSEERKIKVGDKCRILSQWHEIDEINLYVITAEYNLASPESDSYTIGYPTSDREAINKRLTDQTKSTSSKSKESEGGYSSGIGAMGSTLDDYIKVVEDVIRIQNEFRIDLESKDGSTRTQFHIDERHVRMVAHKLFGQNDKDDNYVKIDVSQWPADTSPVDEGWYVFDALNCWAFSDDTSADATKTYYTEKTESAKVPKDKYTTKTPVNPKALGWYEKDPDEDNVYVKSTCTKAITSITYYSKASLNGTDVYTKIPTAEYTQDTAVSPKEENWYEYRYMSGYQPTSDEQIIPGHNYYTPGLWDRVSQIWVDEDGIHGRVDGNYERSIRSSSWIEVNEEQILAITGHLHVDKEGNIIIDAGAGMKTGYKTPTNGYKAVNLNAVYATNPNPNPHDLVWFERIGNTRPYQYARTLDTTVQSDKTYYENIEEFVGQFGVYDEGNLTAGILARSINHPEYKPIDVDAFLKEHSTEYSSLSDLNPNQLGWYMWDSSANQFALSSDNVYVDGTTYYQLINNFDYTETAIVGEHIIIGYTDEYEGYKKIDLTEYPSNSNPHDLGWYEKSGSSRPFTYTVTNDTTIKDKKSYYEKLNDSTAISQEKKDRIDKYVKRNNLSGTITEIASDITSVHALFADYVEADNIVANTSLRSDWFYTNKAQVNQYLHVYGDLEAESIKLILDDEGSTSGTRTVNITPHLINHAVSSSGTEHNLTVTPTVSGDTVTLTWRTLDGKTHDVSFNKPASLGTVTWSSGIVNSVYQATLTTKTAGGNNFFSGVIAPTSTSGSQEAQEAASAKTLTGYSQLYGMTYTLNNNSHKIFLFRTPADRYSDGKTDGIAEAKSKFGIAGPTGASASSTQEGSDLSNATTLNFGTSYMVYKTYDGSMVSGSKKFFKTPAKPTISTPSRVDSIPSGSSASNLTYGKTYQVHRVLNNTDDGGYVYFTTPENNDNWSEATATVRTHATYKGTEYTPSGNSVPEIQLESGGSVTVRAQYKATSSASSYSNATGIKVIAPTITKSDISTGSLNWYPTTTTTPSYDHEFETEFNVSRQTSYWLYFKVTVKNEVEKTYRIKFNGPN